MAFKHQIATWIAWLSLSPQGLSSTAAILSYQYYLTRGCVDRNSLGVVLDLSTAWLALTNKQERRYICYLILPTEVLVYLL